MLKTEKSVVTADITFANGMNMMIAIVGVKLRMKKWDIPEL